MSDKIKNQNRPKRGQIQTQTSVHQSKKSSFTTAHRSCKTIGGQKFSLGDQLTLFEICKKLIDFQKFLEIFGVNLVACLTESSYQADEVERVQIEGEFSQKLISPQILFLSTYGDRWLFLILSFFCFFVSFFAFFSEKKQIAWCSWHQLPLQPHTAAMFWPKTRKSEKKFLDKVRP